MRFIALTQLCFLSFGVAKLRSPISMYIQIVSPHDFFKTFDIYPLRYDSDADIPIVADDDEIFVFPNCSFGDHSLLAGQTVDSFEHVIARQPPLMQLGVLQLQLVRRLRFRRKRLPAYYWKTPFLTQADIDAALDKAKKRARGVGVAVREKVNGG